MLVSLLAARILVAGQAFAGDRIAPSLPSPLTAVDDGTASDVFRLQLADDAYVTLSAQNTVNLTAFGLTKSLAVDLDLERFWITAPGTRFVVGTDHGNVPMEAPQVAFFRGKAVGRDDSKVFLSVSPKGMNGIIRLGEAEYVLSSSSGHQNAAAIATHTIFDRYSFDPAAPPIPFDCEVVLAPGQVAPVATAQPMAYVLGASRVALIAFDGDYEFRLLFGTPDDAALYTLELIAAISTIYENDINLKLAASYVRIWDTPSDPYTAGDTSGQLPEFANYWQSNMGSVFRNTAHLLSGRNLGGGIAYLDNMCGDSLAYGVSANLDGFFPTPIHSADFNNWDLVVVAHELGHNFRSPHTHCYSPPVDQCWNTESEC